MILQDNKLDTLEGGLLDETTFSIDDSNMHIIFDILRSKVYRNPIGSICREIASNSRDAQREIGDFTTPIEIEVLDRRNDFILKDGLNLIFRDFGVGLDPQRVNDIYSKYGGSTKRDTNTLTGGFGLGAKTPFSYTDCFTVRTIVSNVEYIYSIYIDDSKRGKIALLHQEKAENQRNLTEIIIPINNDNDLMKFQDEVIKNTYFWEVRPKLMGFESEYHRYLAEETYTLTKRANRKYIITRRSNLIVSDINVVIDGIYYPVDTNILKRDFSNFFSIVFFLDNGELSISANRENLQYDEPTIELLNKEIDNILEDFRHSIQSEIDSFKTIFEAKSYHNRHKWDNIYITCSKVTPFKYKDLVLKESFELSKGLSVIKYDYSCGKFERSKENNLYNLGVDSDYIFYHPETTFRTDPQINETLKNTGTFVVIIPDNNAKKEDIDKAIAQLTEDDIVLKNYYEVPKTKIKRDSPEKTIKKGIPVYKIGGGNQTLQYDNVTKSITGLDLSKVVYFTRRRDGRDNVRCGCLNELSKILNDDNVYLEISSSNEKYFSQGTKMEDFMKKHKSNIQKHWLRNILDSQRHLIKNLSDLGFKKEMKQYEDLFIEIPYSKSTHNIEFLHLIEFKKPENIFKSIEDKYPLISKIEKDYRKDYIQLVNENIKLKNEKNLVHCN